MPDRALGHALMENRNGLIIGAVATRASGYAERLAAQHRIEPHADRAQHLTVGGDKQTRGRKWRPTDAVHYLSPHRTSRRRAWQPRPGRLMETCQRGALTLDRLRNGGRQVVQVQHVTVGDGGQAVVAGTVQGGTRQAGGKGVRGKAPDAPGGWRYALRAANAAPRCGARRKANGEPCCAPAMANGRCYVHGGPSTGPRTGRRLGAMPPGAVEARPARSRGAGSRSETRRGAAAARGAAQTLLNWGLSVASSAVAETPGEKSLPGGGVALPRQA